jgi:hypothetical protein
MNENEKEVAKQEFLEKTGETPLEYIERVTETNEIGLDNECSKCGKRFHLGEAFTQTSIGTVTDYDDKYDQFTSSDSVIITFHTKCPE